MGATLQQYEAVLPWLLINKKPKELKILQKDFEKLVGFKLRVKVPII